MALIFPVLFALILNLSNYYIFVTPKVPAITAFGPCTPHSLFLVGVAILILDTRLYPPYFRKLHWTMLNSYEFLVASYVLETSLDSFWLPFEKWAVKTLPIIVEFLIYLEKRMIGTCTIGCFLMNFLKTKNMLSYIVYLLSLIFLINVLHATRILDFKILLKRGPSEFFCDMRRNLDYARRRLMRKIKYFWKPKSRSRCRR